MVRKRNERFLETPFYYLVPKGYEENLRYRRIVLGLGYENEEFAREFWIMCSRDILFWINTFIYTYNPRLQHQSTVIPFITYKEYQDETILEILYCIENGIDLLIEKSRDMGLTWMVLLVILWLWQFRRNQSARLVSRVEDLVDKTEDPDSLFWKLDFAIKHQPIWLRPTRLHRTHLHNKNLETESMIDGASTTGDVARGGRAGVIMLDEFAAVPEADRVLSSTRDVSNCRIFVSTHCGTNTAFYRLTFTRIRKIRLHWSRHPLKSRGLYRCYGDGKLELLDDFRGPVRDIEGNIFKFPEEYPFRKDGKLRSPWYDEQCDRSAHPMEIAQELDIDPFSSDFQFFDPRVIAEIESRDVRPPVVCGELEYDHKSLCPLRFVEHPQGKLRLWINLLPDGSVPRDTRYVMGIDISAGTGASNSVTSIGDALTKQKVAEYASADIKPETFAELNVALARFFHNAFMIWDGAGHGRVFGDTVIERYRNVYYRRREESLDKQISMVPGVFLSPKEKLAILGAYRKALTDGSFIQRSHEANQECLQYVFTTANTVEHSACRNTLDPTGARDNHGDRVIADALLLKGFDFSGPMTQTKKEEDMAYTFAYRRELWERRQKEKYAKWYE